eukprot:CAMPEP_0206287616 /NCGR_PEP_ID=MMETSP0106_2-20121207/1198_1 /ASSEMBLY_ACC=CAM_ASM_000206 /TAXON_ID=81532 /ORGANISM="Acanthoeca-like sp., Strain 10tr" /LENGTH=95 /DNA_ID=CAMNT_0053718155 /DNA_START=622 /DNA_END=906 /DNA_ORIENTATION=+
MASHFYSTVHRRAREVHDVGTSLKALHPVHCIPASSAIRDLGPEAGKVCFDRRVDIVSEGVCAVGGAAKEGDGEVGGGRCERTAAVDVGGGGRRG